MSAELDRLEACLGYSFRDREFLRRALTHRSRIAEAPPGAEMDAQSNEQLEFLGDSVLGLLASEVLLERFPSFPEGRLTKLKAHLVSSANLYETAQRLQIGRALILGRGEEMSGGREKRALLANALEAVIGALYLDGGMEAARRVVLGCVMAEFECEQSSTELPTRDFKTALQETATALGFPLPRYVIVKESGPEHAKVFTVEARLGKELTGQAEGYSKKSASQRAAQIILEKLAADAPGRCV